MSGVKASISSLENFSRIRLYRSSYEDRVGSKEGYLFSWFLFELLIKLFLLALSFCAAVFSSAPLAWDWEDWVFAKKISSIEAFIMFWGGSTLTYLISGSNITEFGVAFGVNSISISTVSIVVTCSVCGFL